MSFLRFISAIAGFVFSICLGSPLFLEGATPLKVEVCAKGAVLMNGETGAILFEKNGDVPMCPASTTKLITALYVLEKKGDALDEMITASSEAVYTVAPHIRRAENGVHAPYRLEFGGTHMGIKAGETLSLRTLFYGLMLCSANDAANVMGEYVSGSISKFMEELNAYVRKKGCQNTVLYSPHGLPHKDHKTTPHDMALIVREAMRYPFLREIAKTVSFPRPATNKQPESILLQHNHLVKPGKFYYPKAIGFKTGYTIEAGYTLVAAAEDSSRQLVAVIFNTEKLEQRYKDAIALFEAGFNEKKGKRVLFSKGFDLFHRTIEGGKIPLQAYLAEDMVLEYYPSEEPTFKTKIIWEECVLPLALDQVVGRVQIESLEGKILATAPLFTAKAVGATFSYQMTLAWKKVKRGLWDHIALVMGAGGILILASTFYYSKKRSKRKKGQ